MSAQSQCALQTIYTPVFNGQGSIWPVDIIIASVIFTIQLSLVIFFIAKGFDTTKSRNKQIVPRSLSQNNNAPISNQNRSNYKINQRELINQDDQNPKVQKMQPKKQDRKGQINNSNQSFIQNQFLIEGIDELIQKNSNQNLESLSLCDSIRLFFFRFPDSLIQKIDPAPGKTRICCVINLFMLIISLSFLLLSVLGVWQATVYTYGNGQCVLNQTVSSFISGNSSSWIGLSNIVPNTSQLDLDLKTRVSVSKNAIKGLLLNGTSAPNLKGIGFPIGTNIGDVITGTTIQTTSAQTFINALIRQWLVMNSSLSFNHRFPICQSSTTLITHPTIDGASIQLDYMGSICSSLKSEVEKIVSNGRAIDSLLTKLTNVQTTTSIIDSNLSAYASVYSSVASQGLQFQEQFSSLNIDFSLIKASTLGNLLIYTFYTVVVIIYLGYLCLKTSSQNSKPVSTCFGKVILFIGVVISVFISLTTIYLSFASAYAQQQCTLFKSAISNDQAFNQTQVQNLSSLFDPIHKCTTKKNQNFLMNDPSSNFQYRSKIKQLYTLSNLYNQTTPTNILQSQSAIQTEVVKGYILHLQTVPVMSSSTALQINITQAVRQLELYSNGNNTSSQQFKQCGKIVTQDSFVFNAYDCKAPLVNMSVLNASEIATKDPRCFQIPTYEQQSGSSKTSLNHVQNNIPLTGQCNTVQKVFNVSQANCFMNRRIALFSAAGCPQIGAQYGRRVLKLLKFAIEASQYTDVYLQNLRNFFGVQAVLSTNITEFFNGKNMTDLMLDFGQLSNNLLNKTSCTYIKSEVQKVHSNYCPSVNSVASLFQQGTWWSIITILIAPFGAISFYLLDISIRSSNPIKNQLIPNNQQQVASEQQNRNKINLTQEALNSRQSVNKSENFNAYEINDPEYTINRQIQQQINVFSLMKQKEESNLDSKESRETINLDNFRSQKQMNQTTQKKRLNIFGSALQEDNKDIQELNQFQFKNIRDNSFNKNNFTVKINRNIPPIFFKGFNSESNSQKSQLSSSLQEIQLKIGKGKIVFQEQKANKQKLQESKEANQLQKNVLKSIKKNKIQYTKVQKVKQLLQRNFSKQ